MLRRTAILLHTASLARALTTSTPLFAANAAKKIRPSRDDVDRISWGKPSKKKGVGSRGTPHRLNEAERAEYDRAKARGYVEVAGSAWRKERRDAPLLNTWRNWCDAVALPSISVQKGTDVDLVVVDLSPLRRPDVLEVAAAVRALPTPCASVDVGESEEIVEDEARPIHQLPRYEVAWQAPDRAAAKALAKELAGAFGHAPKKASGGKSAPRVKAGKGRRHGGYGI
ncbi:unnamed protein product [Pelagomonas calceolata]|uniref:Uncharacterized protein n=1 Tax=Pelagomonas calceolata TaxID=35677 RepID=A0A7S4EDX1_9STRA|nr:unnamed protein product [Pelagomonas calceolata]